MREWSARSRQPAEARTLQNEGRNYTPVARCVAFCEAPCREQMTFANDLLCSSRESCAFPAPVDTGYPLAFCVGKSLVQRDFMEIDSLVCYNKTKL